MSCALFAAIFGWVGISWSEVAPPAYADPKPQRYDLTERASKIDPRAKEHPEIAFVFADKAGKPADLQHAVVDTNVARGQLVIWLMGHNQGLFERISSYGLHGIQVHYANGWFGKLDAKDRDDGVSLGKIRVEAAYRRRSQPAGRCPARRHDKALVAVRQMAGEEPSPGEMGAVSHAGGG